MKHSQMPRRPQAQPRAAGLQGGVTGPRKGTQPPAKPPREGKIPSLQAGDVFVGMPPP